MIVTPLFPALITQPGNIAEHKLVLISPHLAPVQPQYVIFEVNNPTKSVPKWLGRPYYMVKRMTLVVPLLAPDGKVILQRWNSFYTHRPMGRVFWNTKDRNFTLFGPTTYLPPLVYYCCLAEKVHNSVEQPDISDANMIRSSLVALLKRRMPEESEDTVKDEVSQVEKLAPQAMDDDDIPLAFYNGVVEKFSIPVKQPHRALRSGNTFPKMIKIEVSRGQIREPLARKIDDDNIHTFITLELLTAESEPDIVKRLKGVEDDHISTVTALELLKDEP